MTVIGVYSSFPNGTIDSRYLNASEAIVTTVGEGSQGVFKDAGASWNGAPDLSKYVVEINSPANGIVGTFQLKSNAPAHYPCGPAQAGQNMKVGPNIGWSNAMPDAIASVDFRIDGSRLAFQGVGYHDKVNPSSNLGLNLIGASELERSAFCTKCCKLVLGSWTPRKLLHRVV